MRQLLDGNLDLVGDFFFDFLCRSTRVLGDYQRVFDRKFGILEPAHILVGGEAGNDHYNRQHERGRAILEAKFCDFHNRRLIRELTDPHALGQVLNT